MADAAEKFKIKQNYARNYIDIDSNRVEFRRNDLGVGAYKIKGEVKLGKKQPNLIRDANIMKEYDSENTDNLKEILISLEEIVTVIDKIGSGFDKSSRTAPALLLFFNQCNVLNKLSKTRKYLYQELENRISPEEYDEWVENDFPLWQSPYEKTEKEILEMINTVTSK